MFIPWLFRLSMAQCDQQRRRRHERKRDDIGSRLCGVPYYAEQLNSVLQLRGFSSGLLRIILGLEAGQWDPL